MPIRIKKDLEYECGNCGTIKIFKKKDLEKLFIKNFIHIHCKNGCEKITILRETIFGKEK